MTEGTMSLTSVVGSHNSSGTWASIRYTPTSPGAKACSRTRSEFSSIRTDWGGDSAGSGKSVVDALKNGSLFTPFQPPSP